MLSKKATQTGSFFYMMNLMNFSKSHFYLSVLAIAAVFLFLTFHETPVKQPDGVLIKIDPQQEVTTAKPFQKEGYLITPLNTYKLRARVLGKKHYRFSKWASISPIDLALGWDVMSSNFYLNQLKVSQKRRWYYVKWGGFAAVSEQKIFNNSANVHILPASKDVEKAVKRFKEGSLVELEGFLVRVDDTEKNRWWVSSRSRTDRGDGSCEVFYVTKANFTYFDK